MDPSEARNGVPLASKALACVHVAPPLVVRKTPPVPLPQPEAFTRYVEASISSGLEENLEPAGNVSPMLIQFCPPSSDFQTVRDCSCPPASSVRRLASEKSTVTASLCRMFPRC